MCLSLFSLGSQTTLILNKLNWRNYETIYHFLACINGLSLLDFSTFIYSEKNSTNYYSNPITSRHHREKLVYLLSCTWLYQDPVLHACLYKNKEIWIWVSIVLHFNANCDLVMRGSVNRFCWKWSQTIQLRLAENMFKIHP